MRFFKVVSDEHRKHPNTPITLPRRATKRSCGYDIYSTIDYELEPNHKVVIWTDVKACVNDNELVEANTRSGNGTKYDIILANTIGWVDSDYYENVNNDGNIGICLKNGGDQPFKISVGDRIAQLKISAYEITDDDCPLSEERVGGFNSTGKQ